MPEVKYGNLTSNGKKVYRIKTTDKRQYEFRSFTINKDTLYIEYHLGISPNSKTLAIDLKKIKSFEWVEIHKGKTIILLSGILMLTIGCILFLNAISGFGQLR